MARPRLVFVYVLNILAAFADVALLYYVGGFYLFRYVARPNGGFPVPWQASVAVYVVATAAMAAVSAASSGFVGFDAVPGSYDPYWISIASPLCVVQAAAVFYAAMALEPRLAGVGERGRRVLARVSGASLGVCLVQMPVINWIGLRLFQPGLEWFQNTVVRGFVVFAASLVSCGVRCGQPSRASSVGVSRPGGDDGCPLRPGFPSGVGVPGGPGLPRVSLGAGWRASMCLGPGPSLFLYFVVSLGLEAASVDGLAPPLAVGVAGSAAAVSAVLIGRGGQIGGRHLTRTGWPPFPIAMEMFLNMT